MTLCAIGSPTMKRYALMTILLLAAATANAAEDYMVQVKERTHGCRSPEETYKFWSLARKNREEAAKYTNMKGCRIFAAGETVALVERDPVAKINGIRPRDEKIIYYIPAADAN